MTHRISHNPSHPNREPLQLRHNTSLGGHSLHLQQLRARTKLRAQAFDARVPFIWNRLPGHVVQAPSAAVFEHRFDTYARERGHITTMQSSYDGKSQAVSYTHLTLPTNVNV